MEYVEEILTPKLRDLTGKELSAARKEYEKSLNELKLEFSDDDDGQEDVKNPSETEMDTVIEEIADDDAVVEDEFEDL